MNKNHFTKDEHLENHPDFSPHVPAGINIAGAGQIWSNVWSCPCGLWIKHNCFWFNWYKLLETQQTAGPGVSQPLGAAQQGIINSLDALAEGAQLWQLTTECSIKQTETLLWLRDFRSKSGIKSISRILWRRGSQQPKCFAWQQRAKIRGCSSALEPV